MCTRVISYLSGPEQASPAPAFSAQSRINHPDQPDAEWIFTGWCFGGYPVSNVITVSCCRARRLPLLWRTGMECKARCRPFWIRLAHGGPFQCLCGPPVGGMNCGFTAPVSGGRCTVLPFSVKHNDLPLQPPAGDTCSGPFGAQHPNRGQVRSFA